MSSIARTAATGGAMDPALLAWSSSFADDLAFADEDLLGSAAHATMLGRVGLVTAADARDLRGALLAMYRESRAGSLRLPSSEEDVHMAVEAELGARLGPLAGRLHTARSRNDQVALDLRLHVRRVAAECLLRIAGVARSIAVRAESEHDTLLPAYTHRQRAQPITAAFLLASWCSPLLRAAECFAFALDRVDELPLGSGACSGTSLPIDRAITQRLLGFSRVTLNALDTVGDRDFALDFTWAGARALLALGKLATDVVDMATAEFSLVTLSGSIAAGSSMMPQKKNPDMFELVRAKSARGVANVVELLVLVKGLASGYNRDQQDDRRAILDTGPLVLGALDAVSIALPQVTFRRDIGHEALAEGFTQATDVAEALVKKRVPFREAYRAVGALVRTAIDSKIPLTGVTLDAARAIHVEFDADVLAVLDPARAVSAKQSAGGTSRVAVEAQLAEIRRRAAALEAVATRVPSLDVIAERIEAEPLDA